MDQQKIQLRKIRDFGENISDTFQFIKQEFRSLMSTFIIIAGVFIIASGIFYGIFESNFFNFFDLVKNDPSDPFRAYSNFFSGTYFIVLLLDLLTIQSMCVVIASYLKIYLQKNESPTFEEVWNVFSRKFLMIVVYSVVAWIIIFLGCIFCLVPGIYFMVVLAPFEIILVVEDCSFSEVFSRCFTLIKENFWLSFGIYAVSYLIYSFGSSVVGFIIGGIAGAISYFTTKSISNTVGIVTGILSIFQHFFFVIFYISLSLNYFNLVEKTDATGMLQKIDMLGADNDPNAQIEEEF